MEALEWFSRYAEFLTPDHAFNGILTFKNMYLKGHEKDNFVALEHENDSIIMMIDLLDRSMIECKNYDDEDVLKKLELRLSTRLNLVEPMLVNYQNLDMAINRNIMSLLMEIIQTQQVQENEPNPEFKVYLKYAMRCLTMCLRTRTGLDTFLASKKTFNLILDYLSILEDEEVVANASKMIKMALNEPEKVILTYKSYNVARLLVYTASKFLNKSDVIVMGKI